MRWLIVRFTLIATFIAVAAWAWGPTTTRAAYGPLDIMPSIYDNGNPVSDFGLHFDESPSSTTTWGGYDYSAADTVWGTTNVWVRGEAAGDQFYATRMEYWQLNTCEEVVRLERYEDVSGTWQWYEVWQDTFHLIHIAPTDPYLDYTTSVQYAGDWYDVVVGKTNNCSITKGAHSHLSTDMAQTPTYVQILSKSNTTCWSDGTQCNTYMPTGSYRKFSSCSASSGTDSHKSGTVFSPDEYECEIWSGVARTSETPGFIVPD